MGEAGIDLLLATSKHNVQYLLGGYRFIFFAAMDAIGHSRYLPFLAYERGKPEHAGYIGNRMEGAEHAVHPFWTPTFQAGAWGSTDAARLAVEHVRKTGKATARIGIEPSFMPLDAYQVLVDGLPDAVFVDATGMLERLRSIKSARELAALRRASELITDSMLSVFSRTPGGATKGEIVDALRREETNRGLHFEYCLIAAGASHNRAVSDQRWEHGDVLSLDSGGNYQGYIGDLCRMGVRGEPDAELQDLLAEVDAVQQAAFRNCKPGTLGMDMIAGAEHVLKASPVAGYTDFFAHGMGVISHEVPFLMTNHPVTYEGVDAAHALEAGMVISVETTMLHPSRGFIKLEDTIAITDTGHEMYGDRGRGWNVAE
ncbi:MAG: aminopeptidase P family protein [Rhizobiaceae bacterium]|nr:aminopeptidase P family protein [Rhizobiaceae bacterium]